MIESNLISTVLISAIFGGCILLFMYIIRTLKDNNQTNVTNKKNVNKNTAIHHQQDKDHNKEKQAAGRKSKITAETKWTGARNTDKHNYVHPWLLTSLKGHTGQVLDMDFTSNGKYLASCAEDRTVLLWCIKDLKQKDRRNLRVNIDYDHARFVKWSPDSKAFIIIRYADQTIEVYKVERKKEGNTTTLLGSVYKALTFPRGHSEDFDIISLNIACNGKYIMTCSVKNDMILWDLKGNEFARVDTYLMMTWCAKISPCGRFVVASGFAPDVKVWEVTFTKTGDFQHVKRAFELSGHTSGVYDVAFDQDSSHMATVSKDGTWKIFQTNVEYQKGEDPHLKLTSKYNLPANSQPKVRIALSPNAEVVVISADSTLMFYTTKDGILDRTIENVYVSGPIETISFDSMGQYLFAAGERHIRVFHNVTGYKAGIVTAKEKLKISNQSTATKERLEKIIADNESFLKNFQEKNKG